MQGCLESGSREHHELKGFAIIQRKLIMVLLRRNEVVKPEIVQVNVLMERL